MRKKKLLSEYDIYITFLNKCTQQVESDKSQLGTRETIWERRKIARNFCQRVWNTRKNEIIPKMTKYLTTPIENKTQKTLHQFINSNTSKIQSMSDEEFDRLLVEDRIKEAEKKYANIIDKYLEGKIMDY